MYLVSDQRWQVLMRVHILLPPNKKYQFTKTINSVWPGVTTDLPVSMPLECFWICPFHPQSTHSSCNTLPLLWCFQKGKVNALMSMGAGPIKREKYCTAQPAASLDISHAGHCSAKQWFSAEQEVTNVKWKDHLQWKDCYFLLYWMCIIRSHVFVCFCAICINNA